MESATTQKSSANSVCMRNKNIFKSKNKLTVNDSKSRSACTHCQPAQDQPSLLGMREDWMNSLLFQVRL